MEERNVLERGVLAYKDILDQPEGKYFVIVNVDQIQSLMFTADDVVRGDSEFAIMLGDRIVSRFSPKLEWYMISADYAHIVSTEQMAKKSSTDRTLMKEFEKSLRPKKEAGAQSDDDADEDALAKIAKVGQYL